MCVGLAVEPALKHDSFQIHSFDLDQCDVDSGAEIYGGCRRSATMSRKGNVRRRRHDQICNRNSSSCNTTSVDRCADGIYGRQEIHKCTRPDERTAGAPQLTEEATAVRAKCVRLAQKRAQALMSCGLRQVRGL